MAQHGTGVIVVTDTSVVLNLAWLHEKRLLGILFKRVFAPVVVRDEFERLAMADQRFHGLRFPDFIIVETAAEVPKTLATIQNLDAGEIAALALALERGIRNVLIDEKAGRTAALALGLQPSGLLGVLIEAKNQSMIPAVLPLLDALRETARFHIADDLRIHIAALAGEEI